ncbi:general stress protein [Sinomonas sp. JGH33]|uniref:General stress protein n=1 Tax=Sinomonas terricola TaxID=3110330 RepID=A0ABU5T0K0_9MICC|nr:general stress protein [Sinomonas sp. JGH33]MEA5453184.1 general stress protein [Sinomonas sp. JGH33]
MSNMFGSPGPVNQARSLPQGDVVGSYTSYLDAQKAVDYLADQQFPVELVAIVGNDLKLVERVTGRLSYPRVALNGALSGMWFGLFVGVLLSFFSTGAGIPSIITSVLMGAAFFMLFGIVTYAMQRGKRDFTSTSQVLPTSYDVVVAFEAAVEARRLLHQLPMSHGQQGWGGQQSWQQGGQPGQDQYGQDQHGQQGQQGHDQHGHQGWGQPEGQWQPPQEQAPQRPSGWTDPYGVNASHPEGQPEQATQPEQPARSGSGYHDLPDGRPQYGIRIDQDQPRGDQEDEARRESSEEGGAATKDDGANPER